MAIQRIIYVLGFTLLLSAHSKAYTEKNLLQQAANLEQVKSALITHQQWVPYPAYPDRAEWDKLLNDNKALLIERAEKALSYPWEVVKAVDYLEFERSGNRTVMEAPFGRNNEALASLLLGELAEGKGRFIDQLINGVFHACEMTSWVLSAHLGAAQHAGGSLPDFKEHVIDLTAGDMGSLLAWTYYFFHAEFDKVNPLISERLRTELQERILDTYMQEDRFWWMAFNLEPGGMVNNWNPWCNFNVLQCFLLLENDRDKLAKAVYRTMLSVDKFINYTHTDGGCEEGPSYWGHAAGKMYDYLQILSDGTGGKVSVFTNQMIRNMGEYIVRSYVGNDWVVNFADASARGGGDAPIIYRYGKAVNSDMMMQHAAFMNRKNDRKLSFGRDVFRTLQSLLYAPELNALQGAPQSPAWSWYPETEFCYMTNTNGFFVAAKGGYNNESHNHNDIGTFSLYLHTTPVFIDAGVGTYTRLTFSSERYTIWTMQSNYHNLPMINGVPQKFGSGYKSSEVKFDPRRMSFSLNIAKAYPEEAAVKTWTRAYSLGKNELQITDNFELEKPTQANTLHFLTWGDVNIAEAGKVVVTVKGEKAVLIYDKDRFEASKETIVLDDPRLSNVWGTEICRVSLKARKAEAKGIYKYTIKRID
jgi:hypothetical protein